MLDAAHGFLSAVIDGESQRANPGNVWRENRCFDGVRIQFLPIGHRIADVSHIRELEETTMQTTNSTILITGGGSGIGRGLAEAFHALGNHVVIAGRNQKKLDDVTTAHPGMASLTVDMSNLDGIRAFAAQVEERFPKLNVLINMAGIMIPENLKNGAEALDDAEAIITTNLLGPIRLSALLLPTLQKQPSATIMNVSSGLAFVPLAATPTYCATKAAIHSYSQSLRYQLKDTSVEVLELAPPYVATELMGEHQASDPMAMPLNEYIAEVMDILKSQPTPLEILVQRVYPLRFAAQDDREKYDAFFQQLNGSVTAAQFTAP